ncbi:hypothetical protein JOF53_006572 [Crossiella equi]|uniref:DNA methylase adenine-specific domain-containing protein n=1 Tax=Crossiella equi TaxID=130796 RepID=A0ABS5APU2_9PSEU|nr:N-6 DNA methylase [Crossiella equi]MBP2477700.1 hypothetical protein [Crossiella equi]
MSSHDTARTPEDQARDLVRTAVTAWYSSTATARRDIPLSVVAAVLLVRPHEITPEELGARIAALPARTAVAWLRGVWTRFARARPDLLPAVAPFAACFTTGTRPASAGDLVGAHTLLTQIAAPLIRWVATPGNACEVDLLGEFWQALAAEQTRTATGQYFTPRDVAALLTDLLHQTPGPGGTVRDPCVGTGGLFLALARRMRATGTDPASVTWIGTDADELALAAAAVNAHLWGLGTRVILGAGDVLTGCPEARAHAQREHALTVATAAQAVQAVQALLSEGGTR